MKKLYTTLMIAMMGLMTLSFTSCETDEDTHSKAHGRVICLLKIGMATAMYHPRSHS